MLHGMTKTQQKIPWGQFCNRVYLLGNSPPIDGNPSRRKRSNPKKNRRKSDKKMMLRVQ